MQSRIILFIIFILSIHQLVFSGEPNDKTSLHPKYDDISVHYCYYYYVLFIQIRELCDQLKNSEVLKKEHSRIVQRMEEQLQLSEDRTEECLGELNVSKEMLAVLRDRVCSLKGMLQEKSEDMVKLQADHQILKVLRLDEFD